MQETFCLWRPTQILLNSDEFSMTWQDSSGSTHPKTPLHHLSKVSTSMITLDCVPESGNNNIEAFPMTSASFN